MLKYEIKFCRYIDAVIKIITSRVSIAVSHHQTRSTYNDILVSWKETRSRRGCVGEMRQKSVFIKGGNQKPEGNNDKTYK